ncbi:hypothetical protein [Azospirillum argentinense]
MCLTKVAWGRGKCHDLNQSGIVEGSIAKLAVGEISVLFAKI